MATTTATSTVMPKGNPKDSMKSTWHDDRSSWSLPHWILHILRLNETYTSKDIPVHSAKEAVPTISEWQEHRFILFWASLPLLVHQGYIWYFQRNLNIVGALLLYSIFYQIIGAHLFHVLDKMGYQHGYLDGEKAKRDRVPDIGVGKVVFSLISTATFRSVFSIMLAYTKTQQPYQLNWIVLPLEIGLYGIVLDFWFYWYHRVMHESDTLWQFHRTHHLTKHPNPLLTLYADHEQEFFDICGIPVLAYFSMKMLGFPMGFYEWWICHMYVTFTELSGHSGLRLHAGPPSTLTWLLRMFDSDICIEDHDLHHRRGWKTSGNYGKQTRLWDKLFGTQIPRQESDAKNIDYKNPVDFPLF